MRFVVHKTIEKKGTFQIKKKKINKNRTSEEGYVEGVKYNVAEKDLEICQSLKKTVPYQSSK